MPRRDRITAATWTNICADCGVEFAQQRSGLHGRRRIRCTKCSPPNRRRSRAVTHYQNPDLTNPRPEAPCGARYRPGNHASIDYDCPTCLREMQALARSA